MWTSKKWNSYLFSIFFSANALIAVITKVHLVSKINEIGTSFKRQADSRVGFLCAPHLMVKQMFPKTGGSRELRYQWSKLKMILWMAPAGGRGGASFQTTKDLKPESWDICFIFSSRAANKFVEVAVLTSHMKFCPRDWICIWKISLNNGTHQAAVTTIAWKEHVEGFIIFQNSLQRKGK